MPHLARPAAIIFDLDGTLVDTVGARIAGWSEVFAEAGIPATRTQIEPMIGMDGRRLASEVARIAGIDLAHERAESIDRRAGALFDEHNRDPRALPGARECLARLDAAGMTWAIATSSRAEQVAASVVALALGHQPRIVDGSAVEHAKPAPDLLLRAAEQLDVAPGECWYVGDSTWDMRSAVAAGMRAIGVVAGAAVDADALADAGADVVLDTLDHLQLPA
jgi:HAD superfamily hydrolase (TIGR01509 family)